MSDIRTDTWFDEEPEVLTDQEQEDHRSISKIRQHVSKLRRKGTQDSFIEEPE